MSLARLVELVSLFRVEYGNRPFWLFLAFLAAGLIFGHIRRRLASAERPSRGDAHGPPHVHRALVLLALAAVLCFVAILTWYVSHDQFYDDAEATMAAVAWLFSIGMPIHHAFDAGPRYAHMYGPLAFMVPAWALAAWGPSLVAAKLAGGVAGLAALVGVYRLAHTVSAAWRALILAGLFAVLCLIYRPLAFWIRPDSFLLGLAAASLLAAIPRRTILAVVGVGLVAGLSWNFKMTGPLYILPALALLGARAGAWASMAACAIAVGTAALPFLLFANVSWEDYLLWVRVSARNGLELWTLRQNLEWALFLLLPLAPSLLLPCRPHPSLPPRARIWMASALGLSLALVAIAASKPGAGPYHLMPFLPSVIYLAATAGSPDTVSPACAAANHSSRALQCGRVAFVAVACVIAACQQLYFFWIMSLTFGVRPADDVRHFLRANPNAHVAMGHADRGARLTHVRPLLAFHDGTYLLDVPAVQEHQMSGLELPEATIEMVRRCAADVWLIPKDGRPFEGRNNYPSTGRRLLLPDAFRTAFYAAYRHTDDTEYFQVWRCRDADLRARP